MICRADGPTPLVAGGAVVLADRLVDRLLFGRVLVQEEDGPVLVADVSLIGQHQLGEHVFIATDGTGILVFHDRTPIDVEGGDEDVFDVVLFAVTRVL